ncbi:MAG: hypothetical protein CL524_13030 [Aequorivita sp.]|nr:hypothetical protein [Aequorivita sp.]
MIKAGMNTFASVSYFSYYSKTFHFLIFSALRYKIFQNKGRITQICVSITQRSFWMSEVFFFHKSGSCFRKS